MEKLQEDPALKKLRVAFLIDEAHRSQEGQMGAAIRLPFRKTDEPDADAPELDPEEQIAKVIREHDLNQMIVAFTATPAPATVTLFGEPFDTYSEAEAIAEGYIVDVAASIISYKTLYNLHCHFVPPPDEEEKVYPKGVVSKALMNVAFADDGLIQYKSEVMLRIFEESVKSLIEGRAKAMIVTSSRVAGLRYFNIIKEKLKERGANYKVLYAFSDFTHPETNAEIREHAVNELKEGEKIVTFDNAIVAAGSSVARIPGFPYDDERIIDSTGALALKDVPKRMLVIGGGIIGLEMATVYEALGAKISVVELMDQIMPGADKDMIKPLHTRIAKRYEAIMLKTKVTKIEAEKRGLKVTFEGEQAPAEPQLYDKVLMAVGRRPNGREINAEAAGLVVNERGFIPVDKQMRTNVPHIFAIGDIVGDPMLAHKAVHEGKVAAENIAGHKAFFEPLTIPSVAYTDPEIAWMGLTETQAKAQGVEYEKASFPWAASGRALSIAREEGSTKVLLDPKTRRILGMGIVGVNAGELIAEGVLALEMGADMEDLGLTIHPHPTLSETLCFAAEMAEGTITDLLPPKKK